MLLVPFGVRSFLWVFIEPRFIGGFAIKENDLYD